MSKRLAICHTGMDGNPLVGRPGEVEHWTFSRWVDDADVPPHPRKPWAGRPAPAIERYSQGTTALLLVPDRAPSRVLRVAEWFRYASNPRS